MHAPDARISRTRDARAQVSPRRAYHRRVPSGGVQASQSHFDQQLQHPDATKYSRDDALHTNSRSRCVQQPRRAHLSNPEMHAPGTRMSGRTHLLPPTDTRVQQGARAYGGDTRLLLSKLSATGGSILPETDFGGSTLSKVNVGGSISPGTYEHICVSSARTFYKEEKQTKKTQVILDSRSSVQSVCIPGA